ncbi:hypothetical protein GKZ90_0018215 [Flavobacterium sp. MC2016-06]|uniref:hypothetical protein n=1 Tax=Flavobacterium sp. MC2016-06 TaxID=2676308 RepID=UPI0012BB141E|nr:hypothetical protein [Flavobacterium sp. MC2016-06]MBU3858399.1 hypothetical protein [Flavobacterium sp. MC2016-06]
MKYIITILFFIIFNNLEAQSSELINIEKYLTKDWKESFKNFEIKDFIKVDSIAEFQNFEKQNFKQLEKFVSLYNPILTYNDQKDKFVDIYSYQLNLEKKNGKYYALIDVGQAIYLCDMKTKYWQRIFFGEYTHVIDDVIWIDENKFILIGTEKDESDKSSPIIYLGNIKNKNFEIFINKNKKCFQINTTYKSKKLNAITIEN